MASTGLVPLLNLPLFAGRQTPGAAIPAAATTGTFGCTVGTIVGSGAAGEDAKLVSEVANNNVKTDTVIYDVMFPLSHFCGDSFTLSVRALHTRAAGAGTVSIDAAVRVVSSSGQTGAPPALRAERLLARCRELPTLNRVAVTPGTAGRSGAAARSRRTRRDRRRRGGRIGNRTVAPDGG